MSDLARDHEVGGVGEGEMAPLVPKTTPISRTFFQKWRALSVHWKSLFLISFFAGLAFVVFAALQFFSAPLALPLFGAVLALGGLVLMGVLLRTKEFIRRAVEDVFKQTKNDPDDVVEVKVEWSTERTDFNAKLIITREVSSGELKTSSQHINLPIPVTLPHKILAALLVAGGITFAVTSYFFYNAPFFSTLSFGFMPFFELMLVSSIVFTALATALHVLHTQFQAPSKLGDAWRKVPLPARILTAVSAFTFAAVSLAAAYMSTYMGGMDLLNSGIAPASFFSAQIFGVVAWPFVIFGAALAVGILVAHALHIRSYYKKEGGEPGPGAEIVLDGDQRDVPPVPYNMRSLLDAYKNPRATPFEIETFAERVTAEDLTRTDEIGYTCLHYACEKGDAYIVGVFIRKMRELGLNDEIEQLINRDTSEDSTEITALNLANDLLEPARSETLQALGFDPKTLKPLASALGAGDRPAAPAVAPGAAPAGPPPFLPTTSAELAARAGGTAPKPAVDAAAAAAAAAQKEEERARLVEKVTSAQGLRTAGDDSVVTEEGDSPAGAPAAGTPIADAITVHGALNGQGSVGERATPGSTPSVLVATGQ